VTMRNPWLKKNPFLSAWLSAANATVGAARGKVIAEAKRHSSAAMTKATQDVVDFWMTPFVGAPKGRAKRRARK